METKEIIEVIDVGVSEENMTAEMLLCKGIACGRGPVKPVSLELFNSKPGVTPPYRTELVKNEFLVDQTQP